MTNKNREVGKHKIFIAELSQETNSFLPLLTNKKQFSQGMGLLKGDKAQQSYRETNTVLGGILKGCNDFCMQPSISLIAHASPGGMLHELTYLGMRDEILTDLQNCYDVSGVIISLHGAMIAQGYDDPEGDILAKIKSIVAENTPVIVILDMHANVTSDMVNNSDLILGFNTYPHVDNAERGYEAVKLYSRIIAGEITPVTEWVKLPALLVSLYMRTTLHEGPMYELFQQVYKAENSNADVVNISLFGGFPYADIPYIGAAAVCTTNNKPKLANKIAKDFGDRLWQNRERFKGDLLQPEEAVKQALLYDSGPIVLVDVADNLGSGSAGDTTSLLKTALRLGMDNVLFSLFFDLETVIKAWEVGEGKKDIFDIGGKVYPSHGMPCRVKAEVEKTINCQFVNKGPRDYGTQISIGKTAVLKVVSYEKQKFKNFKVIVSESRLSTNDPEMLRCVGLEPDSFKYLVFKSKGHFRAAFEPIVKKIIDVDSPGLASLNLSNFVYKRRPNPVWPFEDIEWNN